MFIVIDVLYVARLSFFMLIIVVSNLVVIDLWPSDNASQQTETKSWTKSTILRLVVLYVHVFVLLAIVDYYFFQ